MWDAGKTQPQEPFLLSREKTQNSIYPTPHERMPSENVMKQPSKEVTNILLFRMVDGVQAQLMRKTHTRSMGHPQPVEQMEREVPGQIKCTGLEVPLVCIIHIR